MAPRSTLGSTLVSLPVLVLLTGGCGPTPAPRSPSPTAAGAEPALRPTFDGSVALPPGAIARIGTTRFRPATNPVFVAPDRIAATRRDGIDLWNRKGDRVWSWRAPAGAPKHVAVCPRGDTGAWLDDDDTLRVIDLPSGAVRAERQASSDGFGAWEKIRFSHDCSKLLALGGEPGCAVVFDVVDGLGTSQPFCLDAPITRVAWVPEHGLLAAGGGWSAPRSIRVYRLDADADAGPARVFPFELEQGGAFDFVPASRELVFAADRALQVRDAATGKVLETMPFERVLRGLVASPDGRSAAVTEGSRVQIVDHRRGLPLWEWQDPLRVGGVEDVAFSPDGKLVAFSRDAVLHVMDAATGADVTGVVGLSGVQCAAMSHDERLVAIASAGIVTVWESGTGKPVRWFSRSDLPRRTDSAGNIQASSAMDLAFLPGDRVAALGEYGLAILSISSDDAPVTVPGSMVARLAVSADGGRLAFIEHEHGPEERRFLVVLGGDGKRIARIRTTDEGAGRLALSPDGAVLAHITNDDRGTGDMPAEGALVHLWSVAEKRSLATFSIPRSEGASFLPDGSGIVLDQGIVDLRGEVREGRPVSLFSRDGSVALVGGGAGQPWALWRVGERSDSAALIPHAAGSRVWAMGPTRFLTCEEHTCPVWPMTDDGAGGAFTVGAPRGRVSAPP